MAKTNADIREIVMGKIVKVMEESGELIWDRGFTPLVPMSYVRKHAYRGINWLITVASGYDSPFWFTFKDVQKVGARVRKGEAGTIITFYQVVRTTDKETGKVKGIPFLRYYRVWNAEQLEGFTPTVADFEHATLNRDIEGVVGYLVDEHGLVIKHGTAPCYIPSQDVVKVPKKSQYEDLDRYYETLTHEIAHWTGHESRLAREGVTNCKGIMGAEQERYAFEELVAEVSAAMVCHRCGVERHQNASAYLKSWLAVFHQDMGMLFRASTKAQDVADFVFNEVPAYKKKAEESVDSTEPIVEVVV